jgi:hypothetical protein
MLSQGQTQALDLVFQEHPHHPHLGQSLEHSLINQQQLHHSQDHPNHYHINLARRS